MDITEGGWRIYTALGPSRPSARGRQQRRMGLWFRDSGENIGLGSRRLPESPKIIIIVVTVTL